MDAEMFFGLVLVVIAGFDSATCSRRRGSERMKNRIKQTVTGASAAWLGLMLFAFSPAQAKTQQPPRAGCATVAKGEYDSAKKQNLLHTKFGGYVRTGRPLRRVYWYCQ
jgi:hypothetical protein